MYHAKCLIALFNEARKHLYDRDYDNDKDHLLGIVLAKLGLFMEQYVNIVDGVFNLQN